MVASLWNLTGTSAVTLPMCLLNFRAIGKVQTRISRLRDFETSRSYSKTSYRLVNRGPVVTCQTISVHDLPKPQCPFVHFATNHYTQSTDVCLLKEEMILRMSLVHDHGCYICNIITATLWVWRMSPLPYVSTSGWMYKIPCLPAVSYNSINENG